MASLGDVLSEIFAPRSGAGAPPDLGGSVQEPLSIPVPESVPNSMTPSNRTADQGLLDALRRAFGSTPQPPDGMDAATYQPGRKIASPADFSPPPQAERPWATTTPDSNEGYAKTFGFVPGANDPARESALIPSQGTMPPRGPVPGAPAAPPAAPPGPAPIPNVGPTTPTPSAPANPQNSEMARFFRALFTGAAGVNPTAPKFSAFAQGAGGAMQNQYQERQKEDAADRAREKEALDRALKITKNQRDNQLAGNLMSYRDRKAGADVAGLRYQDIKSFNEAVDRNNGTYQKAVAEVNNRLKNAEITPEQAKAEREQLKAARAQRETEIRNQYTQRTFTPKADAGSEKQPEKKAAVSKPEDVKPGDVLNGWRYKGPADGDRSDKSNWEKVE